MAETKRYEGTEYINTYPLNDDLFFDAQMASDKLTWRLKTFDDHPVLKGPLSDADTGFSYTVGHEYSGSEGSFSSLRKSAEDLASKALETSRDVIMGSDKAIDEFKRIDSRYGFGISEGFNEWTEKDNLGGKIARGLRKGGQFIGSVVDKARPWAFGKFVSAFDFIKVFQGTQIDISLPTLEVTLLDYNDNPLNTQVDRINDVFLGDIGKLGGNGLWGVQRAPNLYEPRFNGLDESTIFPGTFKLLLGDKYAITDLVITGYQVNQSQYTRKGSINPLYADVSIQLTFASYVTKEKLKNYLKRQ